MKKIIGLLLVGLAIFLNIDRVEAENYFASGTPGKCNLVASNDKLCSYSCRAEATNDAYVNNPAFIDFNIDVKMIEDASGKSGYFNFVLRDVKADGTGFAPDPASELLSKLSDSELEYFRKTKLGEILVWDELVLYSELYLNSVNSQQLTGVINRWYFAIPAAITTTPEPYYFRTKGELVCRNIIPKVLVEVTETGTILDEVWSQYHFAQTQIDILTDPEELKQALEEQQKDNEEKNVCGMLGQEDSKTVSFIRKIYSVVKIVIPVLIVALSIVDFVKVVASGKDDDMKKAMSKFVKRIIIAVIFVLVPTLIQLFINISGVAEQISGLGAGIEAMMCILS